MSTSSVAPAPPVFQAEWPQQSHFLVALCHKVGRVAWTLFLIGCFPLSLTIWFIRSRAFTLGIVPGVPNFQKMQWVESIWQIPLLLIHALYHPQHYKADFSVSEEDWEALEGEPVSFKSPDGGEVHGAFFPRHPGKVILHTFGNGAQWEPICEDRLGWFEPLGASVMMVNPRGVGKSTGSLHEEGYALDIYASYEYLIHEEGVDPEDIVLVGHSMGSAYGTRAAAMIQEKYPDKKISVINGRSFAHLGTQIDEMFSGKGFFPGVLRILAKGLWFGMDVKEAFEKLKGQKVVFYHPDDEVIPYAASLAKTVKESGSSATVIKMHNHLTSNHHNRPFCSEELSLLRTKIGEILRIDFREKGPITCGAN